MINIYLLNINHSLVLIHNPNMKLYMVQCQCQNKCFDFDIRFEMIKFNNTIFGCSKKWHLTSSTI